MEITKYIVRFFKVGEASKGGDAILIVFYDDSFPKNRPHVILIDGGYKQTAVQIVNYIKKTLGLSKIDYMFNTHPDADHINGLIEIIENSDLQIGRLVFNRPWVDSGINASDFIDRRKTDKSVNQDLTKCFSSAAELERIAQNRVVNGAKKPITIIRPIQGKIIDNFIWVVGPSKQHYADHILLADGLANNRVKDKDGKFVPYTYETEEYDSSKGEIEWFGDEITSPVNETSLVLAFNAPDKLYLFTGDAGKECLCDALNYYINLNDVNRYDDFDVMQLPHHGSRKNINPDIIEAVDAETYIISCPPEGRKEGHPSQRLINKILEINKNAKIYQTKDVNFIFHYNWEVNAKPASKLRVDKQMDGRMISN